MGLWGVTGKPHWDWRLMGLRLGAIALGLAMFLAQTAVPVTAANNDRTLWLYHTHTGKTGKFTFKKNGQYDAAVLRELNVFLADWRTGSVTKMDPHLFDLLWEVYQDVGGKQPYNIVSSYREPKTNAMLRAKSSGVAENSQHMKGNAMDVFIPGIKLSTLRAAAMRHQVGGVGYYPTSGSPFVHMDTGSVRAWPRMTRAQLKQVFPDGRTMHLPVDGTPLDKKGYAFAQAEWKKCKMVPCDGSLAPSPYETGEIVMASLDPATRSVSTIAIAPPMPMARRPFSSGIIALDPGNNPFTALDSPFTKPSAPFAMSMPMAKAPAMMVATRDTLATDGASALNAIADVDVLPRARVLMTPRETDVLTAYAPEIVPNAEAQRALDMLIQRETAAAEQPAPITRIDTSDIRIAALGGNGLDGIKNIFETTWTAVTEAGSSNPIANTLVSASPVRESMVGLKPRDFDLVAPEIDHVNETLVEPVLMSTAHFAELYEPEGYLDNAAELGSMANRVVLEPDDRAPPRYDIFIQRRPLLVASR